VGPRDEVTVDPHLRSVFGDVVSASGLADGTPSMVIRASRIRLRASVTASYSPASATDVKSTCDCSARKPATPSSCWTWTTSSRSTTPTVTWSATACWPFGALLRAELHGGELAGRFGGEEFLLLLPATPQREAGRLLDRLHAGWATIHPEVTLSTGRAHCRPNRPTTASIAAHGHSSIAYGTAPAHPAGHVWLHPTRRQVLRSRHEHRTVRRGLADGGLDGW
jgi:hypothetical protein